MTVVAEPSRALLVRHVHPLLRWSGPIRLPASLLAVAALSACATTARMHSQTELAVVARQCGVALGEIAQFEEEPRLLFLFPVERAGQFVCVSRWARKRGMRVVYLEDVARVEEDAPAN